MAQSPEELERLRKSGAAGFQAKQQPAPAPKKKPKPSEEMAGVDQMAKWPKPDSISLAMSLQPNANATAQAKPDAPMPQEPQANGDSGFKASIPGQIVGAVLGDNPIPGTGGLYQAVNERGPKIAESLSDGEYANALGQVAGIPGDSFRYGLYGAMDVASDTGETIKDGVVGGFGNFMDGLAGRQSKSIDEPVEIRPPLKPEQAAAETPASETAETPVSNTTETTETPASETTETETPAADKTDTGAAATAPRSNDITMTINEDGIKSFSGRNVGAGATLNGQPFSSSVNVVPSQGMRQLAAAVNPPMARQQPQQQAPALGFASRQAPQRTPKTEFEKQVEREIFRRATTAMRGAQNGQLTASQRGSLDKLNGGFVNERSGFDQQALRNDGMLNQTAMIQAGQDRRDAGRLALDASRLAGDQYAQGFQIRQNERLERLREAYMAAETPEQRSAIAEQLKILNGSNADRKVSDNYVMVDQIYTNEYGQPEKVRVAIDPASGQVLGGGQQSQKWPQPTKANIAALKNDPKSAALFDAKFGPGAAARYGVSI